LISSSPGTDALWLETFQRVCGKVAHELKGALNGVSLNLEVVRSRSLKADAPASAVATFAGSASIQFEAVMDMTEALLALSRATQGRLDIGATTRWLVALLAPAAKADGRELRIEGSLETVGATSADGSAARLAIGATLLAATESSQVVVCRATDDRLQITSGDGTAVATASDDVLTALKDVGIEIQAERSAISIAFPR
jgi:signal transduction histidine kinase